MSNDRARPSVPNSVKRQLRQEAGFGCCVCGNPILQYHHIIEWAEESHHRPHDMMVLCPLHHDQATKGAFPEPEQRLAKAKPRNIQHGLAKGLLAVKQKYPAVELGSITVVNDGPILDINGEIVLGLEIREGAMLLSAQLRSPANEVLCILQNNEWVSGNPFAWDIEADWQKLTIRERQGRVSLSLNAQRIPTSLTGEFWVDGQRFRITKDRILIGRGGPSDNSIAELALVGITLRITEGGFVIDPNGGGVIVSWPDRRERLWKAGDAWKSIEAERKNNTTD